MNHEAVWQLQDAAERALLANVTGVRDAWRSVTLSHSHRGRIIVGVAVGHGYVARAAFNHTGRIVTRVDRSDDTVQP